MMKPNARKFSNTLLLFSFLGPVIALMVLFSYPTAAHLSIQIIPRVEIIRGQHITTPPSYRLTISRPEDIVFVDCPKGQTPKIIYLRDAEAIKCTRANAD